MKKAGYRKIVYWLIAGVLFAGAISLPMLKWEKQKALEAPMVTFGDSCFGNVRDESAIPLLTAGKLETIVFNAAFGGTCAAKKHPDDELGYSLDALSLAALTQAIALSDFGVQQTMRTENDSSKYFNGTVDALELVDFAKTELVLIQHGTNDYLAGIPVENGDSYDEYTYKGALRTAIGYLQKANPNMKIVLVSPTYCWLVSREQTCEEFETGQGYLKDYVQAQKEIAAEFGLTFIDLYHDFYPHETFEDWKKVTIDGVHPNEEAREMIADKIARVLKGEENQ